MWHWHCYYASVSHFYFVFLLPIPLKKKHFKKKKLILINGRYGPRYNPDVTSGLKTPANQQTVVHVTNEEVRAKIRQAIGPHEDLLKIVKRHKRQWYGHVSRSSGLAKAILQGTVEGGRRQGGQRKRWEDNIREWTGLEFAQVPESSGEQGKMEKTGCKIICGAPTTLAVKGLMMMAHDTSVS